MKMAMIVSATGKDEFVLQKTDAKWRGGGYDAGEVQRAFDNSCIKLALSSQLSM